MTVQESKAKEVLNNIWDFADAQDEEKGDVVDDALKIAVENIAELEQYRALGSTPAQICERIGGLNVELSKYYSLGTVEELKEAREKQMAKKPIIDEEMKAIEVHYWNCPSCKTRYGTGTDIIEIQHCHVCGQKIDWWNEDE